MGLLAHLGDVLTTLKSRVLIGSQFHPLICTPSSFGTLELGMKSHLKADRTVLSGQCWWLGVIKVQVRASHPMHLEAWFLGALEVCACVCAQLTQEPGSK